MTLPAQNPHSADPAPMPAQPDSSPDVPPESLPDPSPDVPPESSPDPSPDLSPEVRVGLRDAALAVLALLAVLFALHGAAAVVVPLLLGLTLSYALTPLVDQMARLRLPRALAAGLLLSGVVGSMGWIAYTLSDEAAAMVQALPAAAQKLGRSLQGQRNQGPAGAIDKVQQAATEIERAAQSGAGASPPPDPGVAKVQIEKPKFNIKDHLWPGALGLAAAFGQFAVVFFFAYFLLASGDVFRRKLMKIAGPDFSQRRITLQALVEINDQIQKYLLVQLFTSALVGVATWLAFWWIGLENSAVWGIVAFALNFIPYFGSIAVTGSSALLAFFQFANFEMAILVGAVALLITSIESSIVTPWLAGKAARMNSVAVFVGVLAWGWLWGIWGLFLAVPILMAIKAVCDRVDALKSVGELLGD